jgi:hypothetical protein
MTAHDGFVVGLFAGAGMGIALLPVLYYVIWRPCGQFWRGWRLRVQTADDFERAVRREVDKRWLDLEGERRLRIINLEVQERMVRGREEASPATRKLSR